MITKITRIGALSDMRFDSVVYMIDKIYKSIIIEEIESYTIQSNFMSVLLILTKISCVKDQLKFRPIISIGPKWYII